ncbi:MAG: cell division protein ZapE [Magnetococcales bacterium]|nr:cell division protein ZapE [Magnetococcales bacterium]
MGDRTRTAAAGGWREVGAGVSGVPSQRWRREVSSGRLQPDRNQEVTLPMLDQVASSLSVPMERVPWKGVMAWRHPEGAAAPMGIYLHGGVGRGKSLLMQMIFDSVGLKEKRRVHFHPFMEELHQRLHHARPPAKMDLMRFMAGEIAGEARLLCFDEFYVTTIADGMLLGRLLEALFQCGVTVCATSNWAPDDLYQDGMNRGRIMPFIDELTKRMHIYKIGCGADWRRCGAEGEGDESPSELFVRLTGSQPEPAQVVLRHGAVSAQAARDGVFWFRFAEVCARHLGRGEFLDLCRQARTVILSDLPRLSADEADYAMRFVVLVDLLYETNTPLRIVTPIPLEEVCPQGPAYFAWRRAVSRVHELGRMVGEAKS